MTEKIDFDAAQNAEYFYRYDELHRLLEHRKGDKALRAARRTGSEMPWPHHQVRNAHNQLPPGHAAHRICFWNSLSAALSWPGCHDGWVLQRVRKTHPFFENVAHGDDEHLVGRATIFWGTFPVDPDRPDWSSAGIPHSDIEVLAPSGFWVPMNETGPFRASEPRWEELHVGSSRIEMLIGGATVMLRQTTGSGPLLIWQDWQLSKVMDAVSKRLPSSPARYRWVFAFEKIDNLFVRELEFTATPIFMPGIRGAIARAQRRPDGYDCNVTNSRGLSSTEILRLYRDFGLVDLLRRGRIWHNRGIRRRFDARYGAALAA